MQGQSMFTKKHLIVVHGMGSHTEASFKKEITDALGASLKTYDSRKDAKLGDLVKIIAVSYDEFFEEFRKQRAEEGTGVLEMLKKINGTEKLTDSAADEIARIEVNLGKDEFFNTHWLDVLLYRFTLINERIRLKLAQVIAKSIAEVGGANVHVLGHSLGTAVVHDTLAKAFGPENLVDDQGNALNLNPITHRLGGVHMVANVSRALQTFVKLGASIVRPGPLGCTTLFSEYRHKLDPITRIRPFNPTDNGGWVPHDDFVSSYALIEPSAVTQANVHDVGHYLSIPVVHQLLFDIVLDFRPKKAEKDTAEKAFFATTVQGKAQALQAAFGHVGTDFGDGAIADLLTAWKDFKDLVESLGEEF
jgi:hypothetical protein